MISDCSATVKPSIDKYVRQRQIELRWTWNEGKLFT